MKYKAVLFDLWNTLAGFQREKIDAYGSQLETLAGPERWLVIEKHFAQWHLDTRSMDEFVTDVDADVHLSADEQWLLREWATCNDYFLYSDTVEILEFLKTHKIKIGLITNSPPTTKEQIQELGILRYFDAASFSYELGLMKPDPAIFQYTLETLNVYASEALMVGDSLDKDIQPAAAIGMDTYLLDRAQSIDYLPKIDSLLQLKNIVD